MIHPISSAESSLVFLQPHESRPWTSAVWTSQTPSDHPTRYYIPTRVGGAWHLSLTLSGGAFQRGKPMLGRKQDTEAGECGGNSKMVFFFSFLTESTAFDLKSSWHKGISPKTWMITPKSILYRCVGSPTSQLLQQVAGGGSWPLLFCSFNRVSKSCY